MSTHIKAVKRGRGRPRTNRVNFLIRVDPLVLRALERDAKRHKITRNEVARRQLAAAYQIPLVGVESHSGNGNA